MQRITALIKLRNMSLCRIKIFLLKVFCFDTDKSPVSFAIFFFSVADLKHAIQTKYKIAIQHQVLVVNGGECMAPDRRVCSYSAGTVSACCIFSLNFHL